MTNLTYKKIQIGSAHEASLQDVIVLHGIGSDENSLIPFIQQLNIPGNYYFIQGPFTYGPMGHAFFEVSFTAQGPLHNKEQVKVSLQLLNEWIMGQQAAGVLSKTRQLCFMGFSQGAIMSYAMAMAYPDSVDKVIGLNGRVLKEIVAQRPANSEKRIKIFAFYGLYDDIQPMHFALEAKERLNLEWVDLVYHEGQCAHEITTESAEFVAQALLT